MTNHPNRNITPKQREVLNLLKDRAGSGYCVRYVWTYTIDNEPHTRQIKVLREKGYVGIMYFTGSRCAVSLTDKGRAAVAA